MYPTSKPSIQMPKKKKKKKEKKGEIGIGFCFLEPWFYHHPVRSENVICGAIVPICSYNGVVFKTKPPPVADRINLVM